MTDEGQQRQWAVEAFGAVEAGDCRLVRRVLGVVVRVAARPAGTVTEVFDDEAEREGAYRLLSNDAVSSEALGRTLFTWTAKQCASEQRVYVAVDGSSLLLIDRKRARDLGSVGAWRKRARGLHVLSALAISERGVPIGVCAQHWWARTAPTPDRRNDFRPLGEKESRYLAETIKAAQSQLRNGAANTRAIFVLDRGFDVASVLALSQPEHGCAFVVRAAQNRRLAAEKGQRRYLREAVQSSPIRGHYYVEVPARGGHCARRARVQVQAAAVEVLVPVTRKRKMTVPLNAVLVRELDGPKGASLSWLLLTTESIDTYEQLLAVVRAYSYRWRIEELHRAWKRGGCNVEDMQLRSRPAILKWATIHCAVAARALHLAHRARTEPNVSAAEEFSQLEIDAVIALRRKRTKLRFGEVPDLATMVRLVADAGGYTGKSSGGPPGPTVIARGLERLAIAAEVLANARRSDE